MLDSLADAFKAKIARRMSSFAFKRTESMSNKETDPTQINLISEEDSIRNDTSKSMALDKIIVDLDTQQDVIVEMVDPEFYDRKKN